MLEASLPGINLKVPTILSSGILGTSPRFFKSISDDVGAVTTKSVGPEPRVGNPNPTVVPLGFGLLNSMGLPNPGIDHFFHVVGEAKGMLSIPLIVSVFGEGEDGYRYVASRAEEAGADAVELNLSCPHERRISMFSESAEAAGRIVAAVADSISIPVFAKLSPNVANIGEIASACEEAGASGISAVNTLRAMKIDLELRRPVFASKYGGLSGPALHPLAVRCIYEIYEEVSIPIIGMGGVTNWEDAVELVLAGASAVGIGTAVSMRGLEVFHNVVEGLKAYLEGNGFRKIGDIVGLSHRR